MRGPLPMIYTDADAVNAIDELKYQLKARKNSRIAEALNDALNQIIEKFNLDSDQHHFATLPKENT